MAEAEAVDAIGGDAAGEANPDPKRQWSSESRPDSCRVNDGEVVAVGARALGRRDLAGRGLKLETLARAI